MAKKKKTVNTAENTNNAKSNGAAVHDESTDAFATTNGFKKRI